MAYDNDDDETTNKWLEEYLEEERRAQEALNSRSGTTDGHLVFVYGSLKKNFGNHRLLQSGGGVFLGEAVTVDREYEMLSLGAFPAVYRGGEHFIAGEVYAVNSRCLMSLDGLEGNGHFYTREQLLVNIVNRCGLGDTHFIVPAWTYLVPGPQNNEDRSISWRFGQLFRDDNDPENPILCWRR